MRVPCVTMDKIGIDVHGIEIRATPYRAESRTQRFWAGEIARVHVEADDPEITFLDTLVAKTAHFDRHRFCQLPRQIANVNARAAIDVGRIFVSQEQDFHVRFTSLRRCYQCLCTYFARTSSTGISTA